MSMFSRNDLIALGATAVVAIGVTYVNHRISKNVIAALTSPEPRAKIAGAKNKPAPKKKLKKVATRAAAA